MNCSPWALSAGKPNCALTFLNQSFCHRRTPSSSGKAMQGAATKAMAEYEGFSWHSSDERKLQEGRVMLEAIASSRRQCALDPHSLMEVPGGVHVRWKKPTTHRAAYMAFCRIVGSLKPFDQYRGDLRRVVAHVAPLACRHDLLDAAASGRSASGRSASASDSLPAYASEQLPPRQIVLKLMQGTAVLNQSAGQYEVGRKIGEGTFGQVFAAR